MSEATMTFKEFIEECEVYEYSQEHFDLLKEANSIELMGRFIDNQMFMLEHGIETIENGFFTEAADEKTAKTTEEGFKGKVKAFGTSIKNGVTTLIKRLIGFFGKIVNGFKTSDQKISDFIKYCKGATLTDDQKDRLLKAIEECAKNSKAPISDKQTEKYDKLPKTLHFVKPVNASPLNKFAAVIVNTRVECDLSLFDGAYANALSDNQLKEIFNIASGSLLKGVADANAKLNKYKGINSTSKKLSISSNAKGLEDLISSLEKIEKSFTEQEARVADGTSDSKDAKDNAAFMDNARKCIADTMSLYTAVVNFRRNVISKVASIMHTASTNMSKSDEGQADDEPEPKDTKDEAPSSSSAESVAKRTPKSKKSDTDKDDKDKK